MPKRKAKARPNPNPQSKNRPRLTWRVSLAKLMIGVVACAFFIGMFINTRQVYEMTAQCADMPSSDDALFLWFEKQEGVEHLSVTRDGDTVTVRYSKKEPLPTFTPYSPPLNELGYKKLVKMSRKITRPSPIGEFFAWVTAIPGFVWLVAATVLALAIIVRRRRAKTA